MCNCKNPDGTQCQEVAIAYCFNGDGIGFDACLKHAEEWLKQEEGWNMVNIGGKTVTESVTNRQYLKKNGW